VKGFKIPFRYAGLSILNEMKGANIYIVLVSVFLIIQYCFGGVSDYLSANSDKMNVFELYTCFMSDRTTQIIYLAGVIFLSCGVLFYSTGAAYYLIRADRKKWIIGQILYLLFMILYYNIFILLSLCIACGGNLTFHNEWSTASFMASQFSVDTIGIEPIINISYGVLQIQPIWAGIITLILSILMGLMTGLVMVIANIENKNVLGVAAIIIIWFVDILFENESVFSGMNNLSPFGLSRIGNLSISGSGPSLIHASIFFLIMIVTEIYFLMEASSSVDFVKME